jgi:hypothetical protein
MFRPGAEHVWIRLLESGHLGGHVWFSGKIGLEVIFR